MAAVQTDLSLELNDSGIYDISIADNGDLSTVDNLNTSLTLSFFTNKRASSSEIPSPESRQGWWGNPFSTISTNDVSFEMGSKIWLLNQSATVQDTLNKAISYAKDAYEWTVKYKYADRVEVTGEITSNSNISLTIVIFKNNNIINERVYELWRNTVAEL